MTEQIQFKKVEDVPQSHRTRRSKYDELLGPVILALSEMDLGENLEIRLPASQEGLDDKAHTKRIKGILYERARTTIALNPGEKFVFRIIEPLYLVVTVKKREDAS